MGLLGQRQSDARTAHLLVPTSQRGQRRTHAGSSRSRQLAGHSGPERRKPQPGERNRPQDKQFNKGKQSQVIRRVGRPGGLGIEAPGSAEERVIHLEINGQLHGNYMFKIKANYHELLLVSGEKRTAIIGLFKQMQNYRHSVTFPLIAL